MRRSMLDVVAIVNKMPVVFSLASFAAAMGVDKKRATVYLKKLADKGLVFRIGRGLYSKVKDPVVVAGNLPYPSYITGRFALFYWGEGEAPSVIDVATLEYKKGYKGWPIRFHMVKKLGTFTVARYAGYTIKIATLEQAKKDIRRFFTKGRALGIS